MISAVWLAIPTAFLGLFTTFLIQAFRRIAKLESDWADCQQKLLDCAQSKAQTKGAMTGEAPESMRPQTGRHVLPTNLFEEETPTDKRTGPPPLHPKDTK